MRTKVCTQCGEEKPLDAFRSDKRNKNGMAAECKACFNADRRERRRLRRPEIICPRCGVRFKKSISNEKYCDPCKPLRLKEREAAHSTRWRENNRERVRELANKSDRKKRKALADSYCRCLLTLKGFDPKWITPELISFQRALTKLKRTIKETT